MYGKALLTLASGFMGSACAHPAAPAQSAPVATPPAFHWTDAEIDARGAKRLPGSDCIDLTPMSAKVTRLCPEDLKAHAQD
jgi:hypothetical protein